METTTPTVPRARLISKEEHLAGEKLVTLQTRWGEAVEIKLISPSYRAVKELQNRTGSEKFTLADWEMVLITICLPADFDQKQLDHLDSGSLARLSALAAAFALGEPSQPAATAPTTAQTVNPS